jgi:hypothetical protein
MTGGWNTYAELAITAGAQRCAIFGQNGAKWAGVGPNGGVTTIRDVTTLINDVMAEMVTSALNFDGVQFQYVATNQGVTLGKTGAYACAVCPTKAAIIIVITMGTPQTALAQLSPVLKAITAAGQ